MTNSIFGSQDVVEGAAECGQDLGFAKPYQRNITDLSDGFEFGLDVQWRGEHRGAFLHVRRGWLWQSRFVRFSLRQRLAFAV